MKLANAHLGCPHRRAPNKSPTSCDVTKYILTLAPNAHLVQESIVLLWAFKRLSETGCGGSENWTSGELGVAVGRFRLSPGSLIPYIMPALGPTLDTTIPT